MNALEYDLTVVEMSHFVAFKLNANEIKEKLINNANDLKTSHKNKSTWLSHVVGCRATGLLTMAWGSEANRKIPDAVWLSQADKC